LTMWCWRLVIKGKGLAASRLVRLVRYAHS
jgi:hypothetical protein